MVLYLSIILICMAIIATFNIIFNLDAFGGNVWYVILVVVCAVIIEIIIDLILAGIIHSIKDKHFKETNKLFVVSKSKRKFLEKIGIKHWKDKVVELGALGGFSKSKLEDYGNLEYIDKFLMESYKGIVVHIFNIIFGFALMAIPPYAYSFCVSLPVAIVNMFLSILPILVLQYNIPKLQVVRARLQRQNNT